MADTINIVTAEKRIDKDLSDKDLDFILTARQGVALADVDQDQFRDLYEAGYLDVVNFSHPRALNSIKGVILSESGTKIANVLDNREWSKPEVNSTEPVYPQRKENIEKVARPSDEQMIKDIAVATDDYSEVDDKLVAASEGADANATPEAGKSKSKK